MRNPSLPEQEYDEWCRCQFAMLRQKIEPYAVEMTMPCPYGLPRTARFAQALFERLTDRQLEILFAAGYRRNGNSFYTMRCWDCRACLPIRLRVDRFRPNRSQRRALRRNQDLCVSLDELQLDLDHLELCDLFLQTRYPREQNRAHGYYGEFFCNNIADTRQLQFRLGERLLGSSIIDIGRNFMNAVYFYFDPNEARRSLGVFNILSLIDLCQRDGIDYLYLGYYIAETRAMRYKAAFRPHQLFVDERWVDGGE
ncbi:MAG: arginyltransferase [Desulfobulbaceae bacterium]|jgi:arginine-tRNA-protein transferase|nr:arginyltransferase [Desulfobulbaceae bacterium]